MAAQIGQTPFVEKFTAMFLLAAMMPLHFWQSHTHARKGSTSPGFHRLACDIRTTGINSRPDINEGEPSNLPICDNNAENKELLTLLHACLIRYAIEILGMDPDDEAYVKYYGLLWLVNGGMGFHGDYPIKSGALDLFILRLSIQAGEERDIDFKLFQFEGNDEKASHVYNEVKIDSFKMREGADM